MGLSRSEKSEIIDLIKETISTLIVEVKETVSREINKKLEQKLSQLFCNIENKITLATEENASLQRKLDSLEQYTRRNSIRLFGVPEETNENTLNVVKSVFTEKLNLPAVCDAIDRCHRLKSSNVNNSSNPRPNVIIVKFISYCAKQIVSKQKKSLKGTGLSIVDDLTSCRYKLYKNAIKRFGHKNTWLLDGNIFVRYNGNRLPIKTQDDLSKIV